MTSPRILQAGAWLLGGGLVLLVLAYAVSPRSHDDQPSAVTGGPTPYPSIVLFPTLVETPGPNSEPHKLDIASGKLSAAKIPSGELVRAVLSDGSVLSESEQGPATVTRPNGDVNARLQIPAYSHSELSRNRRYVAWIADDHLQVYDAQSAQVYTVPPPGEFETSLQDGGLMIGDSAHAWPASPPSTRGVALGEETVIVDGSGAITDRLPVPHWNVRLSPDTERVAWVNGDGLHVYDRSLHTERLYPQVTAVTGDISWSPDRSQIAYIRFTSNDDVHLWTIDLASGEQHLVYSPGPGARIEHVAFTSDHTLRLQVAPASSFAGQYGLPAARYAAADDGSGGHFLDDPTKLWGECGPSCGMPPDGYEDSDGLAEWCEPTPGGGCIMHLVFVSRGAGTQREVATGEYLVWATSPDGHQLAVLLSDGTNQTLRIVRLDDVSSRVMALGFTYANNVAWFPDGQSLLLWAAGGN